MSSGWDQKSFNNFHSEKDNVSSGQQNFNSSSNQGDPRQGQSQGAGGFEANGQSSSQNKSHINWDHIVEDEFRKEIGKYAAEVAKDTNESK